MEIFLSFSLTCSHARTHTHALTLSPSYSHTRSHARAHTILGGIHETARLFINKVFHAFLPSSQLSLESTQETELWSWIDCCSYRDTLLFKNNMELWELFSPRRRTEMFGCKSFVIKAIFHILAQQLFILVWLVMNLIAAALAEIQLSRLHKKLLSNLLAYLAACPVAS